MSRSGPGSILASQCTSFLACEGDGWLERNRVALAGAELVAEFGILELAVAPRRVVPVLVATAAAE